jgi:hypothetical protein
VAWGDYDNDGRLDFLLTGSTNGVGQLMSNVTQLWRNAPGGFVNVTDTAFPPNSLPIISAGTVDWGDYDNDGLLDFLLTGVTRSPERISQLWRNTGNGFVNVTDSAFPPDSLPGVGKSSVSWGDYDNDGRLDFLIMGTYFLNDVVPQYVTQIWRNTGDGFIDVTDTTAPGLPKLGYGCIQWLDFNQDGLLDFFLTGGESQTGNISQIWQNTGNGFTNVTDSVAPGLPPLRNSHVAWGDYNNDGLIDFLLTGQYFDGESRRTTQLWRNNGGTFTNVTSLEFPDGLPQVASGSVAWGDYDKDGRLDLLLTGYSLDINVRFVTQIWKNQTPSTNTSPAAPTRLAMTSFSNGLLLSWSAATDAESPSSALTYNVRAGTSPGGIDLLAAHVNAATGFRRLPAMGNAGLRHSLPLTGVTNGQTVYWSVQAVDTTFAGGPFAIETSVVTLPELQISLNPEPSTLNLSWTPPTWGWFLQQASAINPGVWIDAPSGEMNPSTVPATNGARFYYRLFNP